jgi:hypothetical protein
MKRYCTLAVLGLVTAATSALGGPNAGGVLVIHTDDTVNYTSDQESYMGMSGLDCDNDFDCPPYDVPCPTTMPNPTSLRPAAETSVWWVLAAFPRPEEGSEEVCPEVAGLTFGIQWDGEFDIAILAYGTDSDLELSQPGWPAYLTTGTALTWQTPKRGQVFEIYWFAGYSYSGLPEQFRLTSHPTQPAEFADNSVPVVKDAIAGFGRLGLAGEVGNNPVPGPVPTLETSWGEVKTIFGQ